MLFTKSTRTQDVTRTESIRMKSRKHRRQTEVADRAGWPCCQQSSISYYILGSRRKQPWMDHHSPTTWSLHTCELTNTREHIKDTLQGETLRSAFANKGGAGPTPKPGKRSASDKHTCPRSATVCPKGSCVFPAKRLVRLTFCGCAFACFSLCFPMDF